MEKLIALDPSSTHVGWAVFYNGGYIASGVFVPKGKTDARVKQIIEWAHDDVCNWWDECNEPAIVVVEEPAGSHHNPKTDRLLARVGGALEAVFTVAGCEVVRVWPSQVIATGVSKHNPAGACVLSGRGVGPDEADAIGVALAYMEQVDKVCNHGFTSSCPEGCN